MVRAYPYTLFLLLYKFHSQTLHLLFGNPIEKSKTMAARRSAPEISEREKMRGHEN